MTKRHFVLSLYHYNLQYVAGGGEKVEDKIITESFEPIVDMHLRHPNWGGDFEMQGYMLEVLQKRHPQILEKFKKLVNSGQADLVCFHYSDQLFLAFPRHDMEWSEKLNQKVFKQAGIKRSGTVFTQEGQFGEGMLDFMKHHGYSVAILPPNLYEYFHGKEPDYPYFKHRGIFVISRNSPYRDDKNEINTDWAYLNDAELLPTGKKNPYFKGFKYIPEELKKHEDGLSAREEAGGKIVTASAYVKALEKLIPAKPLPPVLDGTWQPDDTENFFLWMGNTRSQYEADGYLRSLNYRVRNLLLAAETGIKFAKKFDVNVSEEEKLLEEAWRHQLFAEVSDSTGWFPQPVEIKYTMDESGMAEKLVKQVADSLKRKAGINQMVSVDTQTGNVTGVQIEPKYPEADCGGIKMEWSETTLLPTVKCYEVSKDVIRIVSRMAGRSAPHDKAVVVFPLAEPFVQYSPALIEDEVLKYPLSDFTFSFVHLPLSNGLIGLGNGMFLIKHNETTHLAAKVDKEKMSVRFEDKAPSTIAFVWMFTLVTGSEKEALKWANKINVYPTVRL